MHGSGRGNPCRAPSPQSAVEIRARRGPQFHRREDRLAAPFGPEPSLRSRRRPRSLLGLSALQRLWVCAKLRRRPRNSRRRGLSLRNARLLSPHRPDGQLNGSSCHRCAIVGGIAGRCQVTAITKPLFSRPRRRNSSISNRQSRPDGPPARGPWPRSGPRSAAAPRSRSAPHGPAPGCFRGSSRGGPRWGCRPDRRQRRRRRAA